jgi:hypothetical protein
MLDVCVKWYRGLDEFNCGLWRRLRKKLPSQFLFTVMTMRAQRRKRIVNPGDYYEHSQKGPVVEACKQKAVNSKKRKRILWDVETEDELWKIHSSNYDSDSELSDFDDEHLPRI